MIDEGSAMRTSSIVRPSEDGIEYCPALTIQLALGAAAI
jgi:hypothetical protein